MIDIIRTESEVSDEVLRHFDLSEQVVVTKGLHIGVKAICQIADSAGRLMVLFNIMSKAVKISVAHSSIRKVS